MADSARYPDPCRELTAGHRCPGPRGAGADSLRQRGGGPHLPAGHRPAARRALVTAPAFSEYAQALGAVGTPVTSHRLYAKENFDLTERVFEELTPGLDVLFLCSPQ